MSAFELVQDDMNLNKKDRWVSGRSRRLQILLCAIHIIIYYPLSTDLITNQNISDLEI